MFRGGFVVLSIVLAVLGLLALLTGVGRSTSAEKGSQPVVFFIQTVFPDKAGRTSRIDPLDTKVYKQVSPEGKPQLVMDWNKYFAGQPKVFDGFNYQYGVEEARNYYLAPNGNYLVTSVGSRLIVTDLVTSKTDSLKLDDPITSVVFGSDNHSLLTLTGNLGAKVCRMFSLDFKIGLGVWTEIGKFNNDDCVLYRFSGWPPGQIVNFAISIPGHDDVGKHGATYSLATKEMKITPGDPVVF